MSDGADPTPLKVLLADDNPVSLKPIVSILEGWHHEVVVVENGQQAIEAVGKHEFDVVLMDCNMPVLDGFDATRRIRDREKELKLRHLPIIALTSMTLPGSEKQCLEAGMDAHIPKPVTVKALRAIIDELRKQA